jgi:hypothetical protein
VIIVANINNVLMIIKEVNTAIGLVRSPQITVKMSKYLQLLLNKLTSECLE